MDAGGPPPQPLRLEGRGATGVDHLGIQTETAEELGTLAGRLKAAGERHVDQADAHHCCYARGDKTWVFDPEGVAWETFHTTGAITHYGEDLGPETAPAGAPAKDECCAAQYYSYVCSRHL